ncbi:MAG: hypothetical protein HY042_02405 [Spirochaetia bacterium]|nr:hypothetical protein [Spirochaetia bacterium]
MKITADQLQFESLNELLSFSQDYELLGILELAEPVKDRSGNVLIKENVVVKESALHRLESMSGQYEPIFKVTAQQTLLTHIAKILSKIIIARIKSTPLTFTRYLYGETKHKYEAYIRNALRGRKAALAVLKVSREMPAFFDHAVDLGLLALGIVIQRYLRLPFVHQNTFLAGIFADMGLAESHEWKAPATDGSAVNRAERSATFAEGFDLPRSVVHAIRHHAVTSANPAASEAVLHDEGPAGAFFADVMKDEAALPTESPGKEADPRVQNAEVVATEALRIARYIFETTNRLLGQDNAEQDLLAMLVYNAEKGFFYKELVNPIIQRFKSFEELAQRLRKIAVIEKRCLHPPSAWAYPKPRAAQVLCKHRVTDCPYIESGWDLHVISPQEAYGWIGAPLESGHYPKCKLESELQTDL